MPYSNPMAITVHGALDHPDRPQDLFKIAFSIPSADSNSASSQDEPTLNQAPPPFISQEKNLAEDPIAGPRIRNAVNPEHNPTSDHEENPDQDTPARTDSAGVHQDSQMFCRVGTDVAQAIQAMRLQFLEPFCDALISQHTASAHTRSAYASDLRKWFDFLADQGILCMQQVSLTHHGLYIDWLTQRGLGDRSIARHLSSLRHFFHFLVGEGHLDVDPFEGMRAPRYGKALSCVLSPQEITLLLRYARTGMQAERLRLSLILEMLYATGMRISELLSLPVLRPHHGEVPSFLIRGKGGHERFVFMTPAAEQALERYLPVRLTFSPRKDSPFLFPSCARQGHLTRQRVGQLLKDAAVACGLPPNAVSPHGIRHAFATHLLHRGVDLITLKQLLGHQDLSTTQIYTHVQTQQWRHLLMQHHPLGS